jgi:hypothetical protein
MQNVKIVRDMGIRVICFAWDMQSEGHAEWKSRTGICG